MQTCTYSILAGALWLAFSGAAAAQGAAGAQAAQNAPQVSQAASKTLSQAATAQTPSAANSFVSSPLHTSTPTDTTQPAQPSTSDEPSQPASLGELARLARAKKSDNTKATTARIYDDDNFPRSAGAGDKAPEISIATADGGSVSVGKSSGKVTLLDFWASWCGPCRQSVPDLKRLISTYGSDQLEVISISEDDNEGDMQEFVAQNGMTWAQQFDAGGTMGRKYGVTGLPTYVLIGGDGNIIQKYVGASPQISLAERMGPDLKQALEAAR
jgi:cytochrome c biogenesis protein CcmG, thiol:disulfide interchange protein DsbE